MLAVLQDHFGHDSVSTIDTNFTQGSAVWRAAEAMKSLACGAFSMAKTPRHSCLYWVPSSGLSLVVEIALLILGRLFCSNAIIIHHHSFGYLTKRCPQIGIVRRLYRDRFHITLCNAMRSAVAQRDCTAATAIIPNAAFVRPQPTRVCADLTPRIVHLSNLSEAKGALEIASLIEAGRVGSSRNIALDVAGPATDASARELIELIQELSDPLITYHGPIYGESKAELLSGADFVVLPTTYTVEAQPLVLLEGAAVGATPVAKIRGCIEELLRALDAPTWGDFLDHLDRHEAPEPVDREQIRKLYDQLRSDALLELASAFVRLRDGKFH
jgi:glycosyltransferase involved in cell wall biosynthesis